VKGGADKEGTHVIEWAKKEPIKKNQAWRLEPAGEGRNFVVSALDKHLVLDVYRGTAQEGTQIIVWHKKSHPSPNQLFRFNDGKIISELSNDCHTFFLAPKSKCDQDIVLKTEKCDCEIKADEWELVPTGKCFC
jgi:hypothetical protein